MQDKKHVRFSSKLNESSRDVVEDISELTVKKLKHD